MQEECKNKGKTKDTECRNYIRSLHEVDDTKFYVCGTNAFQPTCDFMIVKDGQIKLEGMPEDGKGKCPYEPTQRYTSIMVDGQLYSATQYNFLGSEPIILRSLGKNLRTEFKATWLNEPSFVSMDVVRESEDNLDGDDDKIYVFFTETAIEFDFYEKLLIPRIARICKDDLGGQRTLQKKWTSFLKATLICSVPELSFQFNIVQDVFVLKTGNWKDTIFYGVFTPQWGKLDISAVCAFSMTTIQEIFSKGYYKGPVTVGQSHVKWVMYSGVVPTPRPGACINNNARRLQYNTSLDLPDKTLQFVKDHPLMNEPVPSINHQPVLVKRGSNYTRVVVDRVTGLDKKIYDVMFIGTDKGYLHKAINFDGEMFIIEEVQLFNSPEPVESLQLSSAKGQVYVGSPSQVVQVPVSVCSRYADCMDCVLARDPYCAWDQTQKHCSAVNRSANSENWIQSVKHGDPSKCPQTGNHEAEKRTVIPGSNVRLKCVPMSKLAVTKWIVNGSILQPINSKYLFYDNGMIIFNVSVADVGLYICESVERAHGTEYTLTMASYVLEAWGNKLKFITGPTDTILGAPKSDSIATTVSTLTGVIEPRNPPALLEDPQVGFALKILVATFAFLFVTLLIWNIRKGHVPSSCMSRRASLKKSQTDGADVLKQSMPKPVLTKREFPSPASRKHSITESMLLVTSTSEQSCSNKCTNNNSETLKNANSNTNSAAIPLVNLDGIKYIDDESEA
nr:PREDICTED: semaphorin-4E-like isoform X2 [Latimeria chalumnae]|eukprot:XP_014348718.1 PREDICTED: semaphorin-4E-like isoform X2 [Latimeria chalumnae]